MTRSSVLMTGAQVQNRRRFSANGVVPGVPLWFDPDHPQLGASRLPSPHGRAPTPRLRRSRPADCESAGPGTGAKSATGRLGAYTDSRNQVCLCSRPGVGRLKHHTRLRGVRDEHCRRLRPRHDARRPRKPSPATPDSLRRVLLGGDALRRLLLLLRRGLPLRHTVVGVELALLRLSGRSIIVLPYGGDARLPSRTRAILPWNIYSDVPPDGDGRPERRIVARRQAFARFANSMLGCADIVDDLPRVDGIFRFPYDSRARGPTTCSQSDRVVVVHAPNHRHFKGTRFLIAAIDELRAEGIPLELDLVERVSNVDALRRYARADIAADQFLAGAYALFAIEAMALGKPVLCYLNDRFRPWHPGWDDSPIISTSPDTLVENLRRLAIDAELRESIGQAGPAYVERYHSLQAVGADLRNIYRAVTGR